MQVFGLWAKICNKMWLILWSGVIYGILNIPHFTAPAAYRKCSFIFERYGGALLKNPKQGDQGLSHLYMAPGLLMLASVASVEGRTMNGAQWYDLDQIGEHALFAIESIIRYFDQTGGIAEREQGRESFSKRLSEFGPLGWTAVPQPFFPPARSTDCMCLVVPPPIS